jgi:hypothetical protein
MTTTTHGAGETPELLVKCPRCGSNNCVSVPLAHRTGARAIRALLPPPPRPETIVGISMNLAFGIVAVPIGIALFWLLRNAHPVRTGPLALSDNELRFNTLWFGFLALLFTFGGCAALVKACKSIARRKPGNYETKLKSWEIEYKNWQDSFVCMVCGNGYVPTRTIAP